MICSCSFKKVLDKELSMYAPDIVCFMWIYLSMQKTDEVVALIEKIITTPPVNCVGSIFNEMLSY